MATDGQFEARIHDRGYRRYEGERGGVRSAFFTLYRHTFARLLGLRRSARNKVLPFLSAALAYFPGIAFIGIGVFLPKRIALRAFPRYWEYYGFIVSAILLFVAFSAPEALCPDRRQRVLGVYFTSPLNRRSYLAAKIAAVASAISIVTIAPPLLLALARSLQGFGPSPADLAVLLGRILASGALLAVFYTAFALGASALTDRKGFASAGVILSVIITSATAGVLHDRNGAEWPVLINLFNLPFELVRRVYGDIGGAPTVSTASLVVAFAVWTLGAIGVLWWSYRNLEVTR
jgi:ABC-2 type transport system permease protein